VIVIKTASLEIPKSLVVFDFRHVWSRSVQFAIAVTKISALKGKDKRKRKEKKGKKKEAGKREEELGWREDLQFFSSL